MSKIAVMGVMNDLMFVTQVRAGLERAGYRYIGARNDQDIEQRLLNEHPALVIIDLAARGVNTTAAIEMSKEVGAKVLCFGPHVDVALRKKALAAGADKAVANSKFTADMAGLITRLLNPSADEESADGEDDAE